MLHSNGRRALVGVLLAASTGQAAAESMMSRGLAVGCGGAKQETVWGLGLASGEHGCGWAWGARGDSVGAQLGPQ